MAGGSGGVRYTFSAFGVFDGMTRETWYVICDLELLIPGKPWTAKIAEFRDKKDAETFFEIKTGNAMVTPLQ